MAYFHFFIIERQMPWWEKIHVAQFLQKLAFRKNATHYSALFRFDYFPLWEFSLGSLSSASVAHLKSENTAFLLQEFSKLPCLPNKN